MAGTTRKGVWDLQQVRDQYLAGEWEQQNELYSWGRNDNGQLGQNNTTTRSSPVQIPGTTWSSVVGEKDVKIAFKTDGTVWAWGYNYNGQLGQNNRIPYSSPIQIPGTTWSFISASESHILATKTDGTLWSWGYNIRGQLGQNNRTQYSSPVQIPGNTWRSLATSGGANGHSLAIKTDGTLWSWGFNTDGQLGQNNQTEYSSPVQIPGTTWSSVSSGYAANFSVATKTDGTLWSWGYNNQGQLGQNNRTQYSSPVQIPGTTWSSINVGRYNTFAIKTDRTLWALGYNFQGQLAQNDAGSTFRSSPVQIPGTTWSSVEVGGFNVLATKTDGTLWSWAYNGYGALGQNNRTQYSSPVQIPGTQWSSINAGGDNALALKALVQ